VKDARSTQMTQLPGLLIVPLPPGRRFAGYGQAPPLMSAHQIKIVSDFLWSAGSR